MRRIEQRGRARPAPARMRMLAGLLATTMLAGLGGPAWADTAVVGPVRPSPDVLAVQADLGRAVRDVRKVIDQSLQRFPALASEMATCKPDDQGAYLVCLAGPVEGTWREYASLAVGLHAFQGDLGRVGQSLASLRTGLVEGMRTVAGEAAETKARLEAGYALLSRLRDVARRGPLSPDQETRGRMVLDDIATAEAQRKLKDGLGAALQRTLGQLNARTGQIAAVQREFALLEHQAGNRKLIWQEQQASIGRLGKVSLLLMRQGDLAGLDKSLEDLNRVIGQGGLVLPDLGGSVPAEAAPAVAMVRRPDQRPFLDQVEEALRRRGG